MLRDDEIPDLGPPASRSAKAMYCRRVVFCRGVQDSRNTAPIRISFTHIPDLKVENGDQTRPGNTRHRPARLESYPASGT